MNKKKIINDPVYGFLSIPKGIILNTIEHPYFQRLRRIKQLGLTDLVYPGALHTRFHHAIGAMNLMDIALQTLESKGHKISKKEREAAILAILLHDIGHGPFSHALEHSLLSNISHEEISRLIIKDFSKTFKGTMPLALEIFENKYERKFFNQLVSSQLDVDRLDYLARDSFFTGVTEGSIGSSRILKMLNIHQDEIVVEEKGIYSVENFLNTRRLMYWQVYLHKTAMCAEAMLIQVIRRAKQLTQEGTDVFASPSLQLFFKEDIKLKDFEKSSKYLKAFCSLDDYDIWGALKIWKDHEDKILSLLSNRLLNRELFKVNLSDKKINKEELQNLEQKVLKKFKIDKKDLPYLVVHGQMSNAAYVTKGKNINILKKDGTIVDISEASELPNIKAISKIVKKHYLCWPKDVTLH